MPSFIQSTGLQQGLNPETETVIGKHLFSVPTTISLLIWVFKVCNTCKMFYIHGGFHANEYYLSVTMLSLYFYNLGTLKILPHSPHSPSTKPFCCVYLICIYCSATLSPSNFWNTCCQLRPLLSVTSVVSHQGLGECYCILMYTCTWLEWQ